MFRYSILAVENVLNKSMLYVINRVKDFILKYFISTDKMYVNQDRNKGEFRGYFCNIQYWMKLVTRILNWNNRVWFVEPEWSTMYIFSSTSLIRLSLAPRVGTFKFIPFRQ